VGQDILRRVAQVLTFDRVLAVCTVGYLAWVLLWQYSQFVAGEFGYHDLTIISDFFSNAWEHGRPFWVTNAQLTHLRTHFTPSLVLLIPPYVFFSSQFALIAIVACTVCVGIFVLVRDQHASLRGLGLPHSFCALLAASCFVAFAGNRYTLRVLSSAHFEPFFILTAILLLAVIRRGAPYRWLLPALCLALGVRQDAGFFLFFLLLSCLVAPKVWGERAHLRVLVAAGVCVAYVAFASKVIMPWFGNDGGTRFWQSWGNTWPEVFLAWFRSPERVIHAIGTSEFEAFNAELLYVPMVNPLAWLANQAPAILFYTADAFDKQRLMFYNSAFLLPGLMLCFVFAQLHVLTLVMRFTVERPRWRQALLALSSAFFVFVAVSAAVRTPRQPAETLTIGDLERHDPFALAPLRQLADCPNVRSVAADFRTIVYAPLHLDKYLHEHAPRADLVVIKNDLGKNEPFFLDQKRLAGDLTRDGHYVAAGSLGTYDYYLAPRIECEGVTPK